MYRFSNGCNVFIVYFNAASNCLKCFSNNPESGFIQHIIYTLQKHVFFFCNAEFEVKFYLVRYWKNRSTHEMRVPESVYFIHVFCTRVYPDFFCSEQNYKQHSIFKSVANHPQSIINNFKSKSDFDAAESTCNATPERLYSFVVTWYIVAKLPSLVN